MHTHTVSVLRRVTDAFSLGPLHMLTSTLSLAVLASAPPDASSVSWLDILGLALVVLFAILGIRRGLWWQIVRLLGIVCAVAVARACAPWLGTRIDEAFSSVGPRVSNGLAWTAIFLACALITAIIGRKGQGSLEEAEFGGLDRFGGAIAGAITGALVHTALLLCLCQVLPEDALQDSLRGSRSAQLLATVRRGVPALLDARAAESVGPATSESVVR